MNDPVCSPEACTGAKTMTLDFSNRVSLPADVLVRHVEQESVILNLNNGRYFGLDDVGTSMLNALSATETIQAAFDRLLSEYDVEPHQLRSDLHGLLERLLQAEVLHVHGK